MGVGVGLCVGLGLEVDVGVGVGVGVGAGMGVGVGLGVGVGVGGGLGVAAVGVTGIEAADQPPGPTVLAALIRNRYSTPLASPVAVHVTASGVRPEHPAGSAQVVPPSED